MVHQPIRFIDDPPHSGSWNMSVDQALLESVSEGGGATLRIYRWQPATISLGYFQRYEQRRGHEPSLRCPAVRRSTGGGAIVHDYELTYSLILPSSNQWALEHKRLFETVHQCIIECLTAVQLVGCAVNEATTGAKPSDPFLCFQRRAKGDVTVGDYKVIGSAQRRTRGALLQHGSILIERSEYAPELPGLVDLFDSPWDRVMLERELAEKFANRLANRFEHALERGRLSRGEIHSAESIDAKKFGSKDWTKKR